MKTKYRIIQWTDGKYAVQYKFKQFFGWSKWHETYPIIDLDEAEKTLTFFLMQDHARKEKEKHKNDFRIIKEMTQ